MHSICIGMKLYKQLIVSLTHNTNREYMQVIYKTENRVTAVVSSQRNARQLVSLIVSIMNKIE